MDRIDEITERIYEIIKIIDIYDINDKESIDILKDEVNMYMEETKKMKNENNNN